jgi:hypothetical protein
MTRASRLGTAGVDLPPPEEENRGCGPSLPAGGASGSGRLGVEYFIGGDNDDVSVMSGVKCAKREKRRECRGNLSVRHALVLVRRFQGNERES